MGNDASIELTSDHHQPAAAASYHQPVPLHAPIPFRPAKPSSLHHGMPVASPVKPTIIYVLQLEDGCIYVGMTTDMAQRLKQHEGLDPQFPGAAWTQLHKPTGINPIYTEPWTEFGENNVTKKYMRTFGIDKVRGGTFCQINLPADKIRLLEDEIYPDLCHKCRQRGHYITNCPLNSVKCEVCGKTNHATANCRFKSKNNNKNNNSPAKVTCTICYRDNHSSAECFATYDVSGQELGFCTRCGRNSHKAPECYAKTHLNGYDLKSCEKCGKFNHATARCTKY